MVGQVETKEEAVRDLEEALYFTLDNMLEEGEPLPEYDNFVRYGPDAEDPEWVFEIKVAI